jgi:hypothetical protein
VSLKDLGYKPRRNVKQIILDDTLRVELEEARAALKLEKARPDRGLSSEAEQRVEAVEAAAREAAVSFVFEALSRPQLAALIADCPPSLAQLEKWKEEDRNNPLLVIPAPEFDYEKFPPRLIAASLVEPETTEAEVLEMWESGEWPEAVWDELWKTAWNETNRGVSTLPTLGIGSVKTPASDPASPTQ